MVKKMLDSIRVSGLKDGSGGADMTHILAGDELPENASLMAFIDLDPGADVGYHKHECDNELYYIMEGEGEYTENGEVFSVSAGTATMVYAGDYHGIKNTGSGKLKMLAVVINN